MSTIINTYPVFESSQVLTSSQLNQVVSYLDQQGRLTRTRLIGMGIVCGLELSYDDSGGDLHITISKGTAVTSEGYLIKLGNCVTSWYRPYSLPESVKYAPFDNTDPAITLFELLREQPEDGSDVISLNSDPGFLDDKFVLLFLEAYDNDIKPCLGNTCDELGIDRIFTIRKLLINRDDLDELLEHSANVGNLYPKKFDLPDMVMPRTLFDPDADHSQEVSAFTNHHISSIHPVFTVLFGEKNGDGARTPGALHQSYSVYDLLLGAEYGFENPFGSMEINGLIDDFETYLADASDSGTNTPGIQYFSDFMKDLILAYDEFRETAFELVSECCPDMSRFPKHVMLGRAATEHETPEEVAEYRHGFVQPPIYNHQKYLMEKAVSLHKRLVLMVESFSLDLIQNPDPDGEEMNPLRITPSDEKNTPLSRRSIPFYYDIKSEGQFTEDDTLEQHWNFDLARRAGPGENVEVLSYHNQAEDQSEILSPTETPLYYDLDSYPFLRIEGLLGRHHGEIIERLQSLQRTFNLPFDVTALQLDPEANLLSPDYSCGFEDLQEEYKSAQSNYCGFTRDLMQLLRFAIEHQESLFGSDEETTEDLHSLGDISKSFQTVCRQLPECLDEFSFVDFQQSYKEALQQLLHFILIEKRLLEEIDFNEREDSELVQAINGFIQHLSPLLYRFVDLLFYNTFLRVYLSFRRREYYLQQKNVFSSYLRNHPGVVHQAGVPKGGTFIVLYNSAEEPAVIGDFSLPYLCCGTDHCIPMCDERDGDFVPDIPPFARPDFVVTTIGRPVEIRVSVNDYGMENRPLAVEIEQEETEGGSISLTDEEGTILYRPHEVFQGVDRFYYILIDRETGNSDQGLVTVLVKEEDVDRRSGCYPPEILTCWADGDVDKLLEIYQRREPDDPVGDDIQTVANALHQSLRRTGGFTDNELDRTTRLEDPEERRFLLQCIYPDLSTENIERDELGRRIRQYQEENCGNHENPCTVTEVWGQVVDHSTGEPIPGATIMVEGTSRGATTDMEGNFYLNLGQAGQTLRVNNIGYTTQRVDICHEAEIQIMLQENELRTVGINVNFLDRRELVRILDHRNIGTDDVQNEEEAFTKLNSSERGNSLTREELQFLKNDTLKKTLDDKGISYLSQDNKDDLVNKLLRG
ncbi:carboxypeptidase-like regulatory domain-containing protein [Rhodohalobacter sp. SW132]|uniref:carboxypeptidase-like regulatory domain-containing protein n=1 Tax=Rhodohalobacter sp. SW132 TaxID=2293433 RepID=UPI000E284A8C|nr:carboxypeptidase-like regulatory domain-containing protein [Rhodohalobacter sp. SW132]REL24476.1 carboxypeptidase-like regulatory domain-containing protein [Rhodohalobacter sp. SW132]